MKKAIVWTLLMALVVCMMIGAATIPGGVQASAERLPIIVPGLTLVTEKPQTTEKPQITLNPQITRGPSAVCRRVGHAWEAVSALGATCDSAKQVTYQCTRCGEKKTETEGSPLGHDMEWTGVWLTVPNCTTDGYKQMKCTRCGTEIRTLSERKWGHHWELNYTEPATCAADGYKSYHCTNLGCKETKIEALPATGKCTWGNWIVVTEATCLTDGLKVAECTVCGDTKKEVISAEGYHTYKTVKTVLPTCEKDGSRLYECTKCGKNKTETLKASGHDWQSSVIVKAATCTTDGVAEVVCSKCNQKQTQVLKATGHSWKDSAVVKQATCTEAGSAESRCTRCGLVDTRVIDKLDHSWGSWVVTKKATSTESGTRQRTCKLCGKKETQKIKATSSGAATTTTASQHDDLEGIQVFTTAGKVNLRKGPGKENRLAANVAKKNTCLGDLLGAELDKNGVVWFKVEYKKKECWVMGDFSEAIVGELDLDAERLPTLKDKKELTRYFLKSFEPAVEALELVETYITEDAACEWSSDAVLMAGWHYVERIELTDKGYTLYGVKVGDKIKTALKTLKSKEILLVTESEEEYVYRVPCSPDSLSIDAEGFAATLSVLVDADGRVEAIHLWADMPEDKE